jgi:AcrR family transcriptional regulator
MHHEWGQVKVGWTASGFPGKSEGRTLPKAKVDQESAVRKGSDKTPRRKKGVRLDGDCRREQIAQATFRLMALHGLQGTTVARIAKEVGIEAPSLYRHYPDRHHMVLGALDILSERIEAHLDSSSQPNVLERLQSLVETHTTLITGKFDEFVTPSFQVIAAPQDSGLPQMAGERTRKTLDRLTDIAVEGKRQGVIRKDMDPQVAAFEILLLFEGEDLFRLVGIDEFISKGISKKILEVFLRDMAAAQPDALPI